MDMDFKWKRRLTYATIALMFLFTGVEYAVVFPTIWAYLQHLGARNATFLGLSVAAFSVSPMLVGPVVGKWFDHTQNAKLILAIMNVFEIIGSILYFIGFSPWFIVLSRFICGMGSSSGSAVLADISSSTAIGDRTAILANFQACRQVGLLIGPVFNLLLRQFNFKLGPFVVNKLTAPGIFMAIIGIIMEALFLISYYNLVALSNDERLTESLRHSYVNEQEVPVNQDISILESDQSCISVNNYPVEAIEETDENHLGGDSLRRPVRHSYRSCDSNEMIESADCFMGDILESSIRTESSRPSSRCSKSEDECCPGLEVRNGCNNMGSSNLSLSNVITNNQMGSLFPQCVNEFLRDEVIVLFGLTFVTLFAQMSLETVATPLTKQYFNFDDFGNSLFFLFAGIEILCAFLLISVLSRRCQDRVLILSGSIMMIVSLSWYLIFVPCFQPGDWAGLPYFIIGVFINLFGIAVLIACCTSLFSKLIAKENQGIGHGLRRTIANIGMILGPLWGGSTVHSPTLLFGIPLAVVSIFTILFCVSFKSLHIHAMQVKDNVRPHAINGETTPLLIKA